MTSQIFGIMYLNELDHFIKEKLGIKYYIRYMDDGVLIHHNKEYLKYCLKEIKKIIAKYKIELNYKKTRIFSNRDEIEFLGFRFISKNKIIMKVKNQTKRRFKRKMKNLYKLYEYNQISLSEYKNVESSYAGHLKHGSCKRLFLKSKLDNIIFYNI